MKRFATVFLLMVVMGGCAVAPQQVKLSPMLTMLNSVEGANITVSLRVVDDRPSKPLGRMVSASGASVDVTSEEEVAGVVEKCLIEGLKRKGFSVTAFSEELTPRLTVEIDLLDYAAFKGFPAGRAIIKGGLKAVAVVGKTTLETTYRADREEKLVTMPSPEKTEKWINSVLGEVVSNLLSDSRLLKFLAG